MFKLCTCIWSSTFWFLRIASLDTTTELCVLSDASSIPLATFSFSLPLNREQSLSVEGREFIIVSRKKRNETIHYKMKKNAMKISRDHGDGRFERNGHYFFLRTKSISHNRVCSGCNRDHDKWDTCDCMSSDWSLHMFRYELGLSTQTLILAAPYLIDQLSAMRHASQTAGK